MNVAELCGLPSESRAIRAIRLRVANYKTTLSANSLETATDSSNSLPSTIQSESCHETPPDAGRPWSDNGYGLVELIAELGEAEMGLQRIRANC